MSYTVVRLLLSLTAQLPAQRVQSVGYKAALECHALDLGNSSSCKGYVYACIQALCVCVFACQLSEGVTSENINRSRSRGSLMPLCPKKLYASERTASKGNGCMAAFHALLRAASCDARTV